MTTPITITSPQLVVSHTGQRGNGWFSGSGAPSNSLGIDGDFYLDTTNVGIYYGPRSGGVWSGPHAFTGPLANYSAGSSPTVNNDITQGYSLGSVWINTSAGVVYVCTSNAVGAAAWLPVLPVGTTSGTVAAGNDSRIVNSLQVGNNLSDVANATTARTNLGLAAIVTAKSNLTATTSPSAANDLSQGYAVGSVWVNTTTHVEYVCSSAAASAAVWTPVLPVGTASGTVAAGNDSRIVNAIQLNSSAGGDLSGTLPNPTVSKITGVSVSGTPAYGQSVFATSPTAASWSLSPGFFANTGLASGGVMSFNGGFPTQFNISAGVGYVADYVTVPANPTITQVTIAAQTIDLTTFVATPAPTTRATNWWLVNSSGVISVQGTTPTNTQRRTMIILGVTGSVPGTGVLFNVQSVPNVQVQPGNQTYDLMYALGPFSNSGNLVTAHSSTAGDFGFVKAVGSVFDTGFNYPVSARDPHVVTSPVESPAQFKYATRVAGSETALTTNIDVTHFDNNGVVTAIGGGAGTSSIHRVYLFGTGVATQQLAIQYGQATYTTLSNAVAAVGAEPFVPNPDFSGIGYVIAWICATRSAASLGDAANVTIVQAPKFAVP